jgi:hypothetical protein
VNGNSAGSFFEKAPKVGIGSAIPRKVRNMKIDNRPLNFLENFRLKDMPIAETYHKITFKDVGMIIFQRIAPNQN